MKTKEELDVLKKEVEALRRKLSELSEDELEQVVGGIVSRVHDPGDMHVIVLSDGESCNSNYDINIYKNDVKDDFHSNIR